MEVMCNEICIWPTHTLSDSIEMRMHKNSGVRSERTQLFAMTIIYGLLVAALLASLCFSPTHGVRGFPIYNCARTLRLYADNPPKVSKSSQLFPFQRIFRTKFRPNLKRTLMLARVWTR